MSKSVLAASNLEKTYSEGRISLSIFKDLDFELQEAECVAIVGSSGAGKTTLLNLLGGLDKPTGGDVLIAGQAVSSLSERDLGNLRNSKLGFVYQFHHLLNEFTALENVAMPLLIAGVVRKEAYARANEMLTLVGLGERCQHKPAELSGGERQRVAIARALVNNPVCVLMDEPTGNLDEHTAEQIQRLIFDLQKNLKTSFVVVTHDMTLAKKMDKVLQLTDGKIQPLVD